MAMPLDPLTLWSYWNHWIYKIWWHHQMDPIEPSCQYIQWMHWRYGTMDLKSNIIPSIEIIGSDGIIQLIKWILFKAIWTNKRYGHKRAIEFKWRLAPLVSCGCRQLIKWHHLDMISFVRGYHGWCQWQRPLFLMTPLCIYVSWRPSLDLSRLATNKGIW